MRSGGVGFVVVGVVCAACVRNIEDAYPGKHKAAYERCDDLRRNRDLLAMTAAGLGVLSGAGGVAAIELDDPDHKRHLAYVGLAVGFLAAAAATYQNNLSTAYADEGCPALYEELRRLRGDDTVDAGPVNAGTTADASSTGDADTAADASSTIDASTSSAQPKSP
jgi:hypothetical protein